MSVGGVNQGSGDAGDYSINEAEEADSGGAVLDFSDKIANAGPGVEVDSTKGKLQASRVTLLEGKHPQITSTRALFVEKALGFSVYAAEAFQRIENTDKCSELAQCILRNPERAEKLLKLAEEAEGHNLLKVLSSDISYFTDRGELDVNIEDIELNDLVEMLQSANKQGLNLSGRACLLGSKSEFTYEGTEKTQTASIRTIKILGAGTSNTVYLGWEKLKDKFIAIRKGVSESASGGKVVLSESKFRKNTEKTKLVYEQLIAHNESNRDLLETPDALAWEGNDLTSIRELAQGKDLEKSRKVFSKTPKKLINPLFKELRMFQRAGIGMGDVKPANINVYRNEQGEAVPKFSDLDGSVSVEESTKAITQALASVKDKLQGKSDKELRTIIKYVAHRGANSGERGELKDAYNNLRDVCRDLVSISVSPGYTFGSMDKARAFMFEILDELADGISSVQGDNDEEGVRSCVEKVVQKIQLLDIKATSVSCIETILGKVPELKESVYGVLKGEKIGGDQVAMQASKGANPFATPRKANPFASPSSKAPDSQLSPPLIATPNPFTSKAPKKPNPFATPNSQNQSPPTEGQGGDARRRAPTPPEEKETLAMSKNKIRKALDANQVALPQEDRLPDGGVELLMDMLSGDILPNEVGFQRIDSMIQQTNS
jgi:hypothetical protein